VLIVKQQAVTKFLTHENEALIRTYWQLLAFYGEDTMNMRTASLNEKIMG
jgi:hypothetical protein